MDSLAHSSAFKLVLKLKLRTANGFRFFPFRSQNLRWFHLVWLWSEKSKGRGSRCGREGEERLYRTVPTIQKSIFICKTITFTFIQCSLVRSAAFFCMLCGCVWLWVCVIVWVCVTVCCCCVCAAAIGSLTLEWTFIQFAKQPQAAQWPF